MKVGDVVTAKSFYLFPGLSIPRSASGIIIDSQETAATRRADEGKNTHCHLIYWNVLSPTGPCTEWVMERGLEVISESR